MGATVEPGDTITDLTGSSTGAGDTESIPLTYILDPYGNTPLSAIVPIDPIDVGMTEITEVTITVRGQGPGASNLSATLDPRSSTFQDNFSTPNLFDEGVIGVPVLGLYPESENVVEIMVSDGELSVVGDVVIQTPAIPEQSENVEIRVEDETQMGDGLIWVKDRLYDAQGNLRWKGPAIDSLAQNGNILAINFREVNWVGRVVHRYEVPGIDFHHDIVDSDSAQITTLPFGSWMMISKNGEEYVSTFDMLVELDDDNVIQNLWDLREYLDVSRNTVVERGANWLHVNTVVYDEMDDSLIISGRWQGILKVTRNGVHGDAVNEGKDLVWILGPHLGWGTSGWDGSGPLETSDYLLTAVDDEGTPYPDDFQNNLVALEASNEAFHWPVGQHGIQITSREPGMVSLLTFNNQASFVFDGPDSIFNGVAGFDQGDVTNDRAERSYSMLNEYVIDEESMTVRQVWGYGANEPDLYGSFMGGVTYNEDNDHRFMSSNGTDLEIPNEWVFNPHLVEVTAENEVVFHLEITNTEMSAYRGGRIDPYHPAG